MVDSLAITSDTAPGSTLPSIRGAAPAGDGGCGNFAQALHDAQDGRAGSAKEAQAKASTNPPAVPAGAAAKTQTTVAQGSGASIDGPQRSLAGDGDSVETADEVAAVSEAAQPAGTASANPDPADAPVQGVDRTDARFAVSLTAAAPTESKRTASVAADHPAKADAAKPQEKKHTAAADDDANLTPPSQTFAGTNSVVAAVPALTALAASQPDGRAASPQKTTLVRLGGPFTQAAQTGPATTTPVVPAASAQAGSLPQDQQASDVVPSANTASPLQQSVPLVPPTTSVAVTPRPSPPTATVSFKTSQTPRTAKDTSSPGGNAATDESLALVDPSIAGKAVDLATAPATSAPQFATSLSRHVAAEATISPVASPVNTHATAHVSQSSAAIGSDIQAGGSLLQQPGEAGTRSSALEVGFHDANLGWLSVRASTDVAGGLHAAVGAKTPAALASVDSMLPALGRFLQQENVAVHTVSAAGVAAGPTIAGFASAAHAHTGSGDTGSPAQQQGTGREASQRNHDRNSGSESAPTGRSAPRLTSASTILRYSQSEQLSTVSVRI